MTDTSAVGRRRRREGELEPAELELAEQLVEQARSDGLELLGDDGVLARMTKAVLERGLAEELTEHLGYDPNGPAGHGSGNSRNGTTPKTVHTEAGSVDLAVPRD